MEENKNVESNENTNVQEKPKKKNNAALILGIIGTSTGALALLIILFGLFFGGARYNMMDDIRNDRAGSINMMDDYRNGRTGRVEVRGGNNFNSDFCDGFGR